MTVHKSNGQSQSFLQAFLTTFIVSCYRVFVRGSSNSLNDSRLRAFYALLWKRYGERSKQGDLNNLEKFILKIYIVSIEMV